MRLLQDALRAGRAGPSAAASQRSALVIGGAGALGSAVLEKLLAARGFSHARVVVTPGFRTAMRGLETLTVASQGVASMAEVPLDSNLALVVFDRERRANGREDAFVRPRPEELPALARWLPQRLADGALAQLRLMVPQTEQPVRVQKVAAFVVELALRLASSDPGTRVAPPELVWLAAQGRDPGALVQDWLAGRELPPLNAPRMRL